MAAPAATTRQTPAGKKLEIGFVTKMTLASDPDISLWEIGVTPPGYDGGEPIDTTDQWNTTYRTKTPRVLLEGTDAKVTFHYDPAVKTQIVAVLNVPTTITVRYPDGSTEAFYGTPRVVEFDEMNEESDPRGTLTVTPLHYDPTNDVEAGATVTSVAGT